jgi:hypothetical protein
MSHPEELTYEVIGEFPDSKVWRGKVRPRWALSGSGWLATHEEMPVNGAYCETPEGAIKDLLLRNRLHPMLVRPTNPC